MKDVAKIFPVILSGGAGSRLWPASRQSYPKQLLPLISDDTMIQETAARVTSDMFHDPIFICNAAHAEPIRSQLQDKGIKPRAIIIEPKGRNTAPCAVIAALYARAKDPNAQILLLPADHHVTKPVAFRRAIAAGIRPAQNGKLITFGIKPDSPATGYGYIRQGEQLSPGAYEVDAFVEKPDLATARAYLEDGHYLWNAGIFLFEAETLLSEMNKFRPDIVKAATASFDASVQQGDELRLDHDSFAACPSESIDFAVMESTSEASIVPADIGWNDIGSFTSLYDLKKNGSGNALSGDILTRDTTGCLIETDGPIVTTIGVNNLAIIIKDGAVLVTNLDQAQDVKKIVETLKEQGRTDLL